MNEILLLFRSIENDHEKREIASLGLLKNVEEIDWIH